MILLSATQLTQSFGGKTLFEGIGFGVEEGDRIGLVGPNGAGKSTLLKILAGQMQADSGQVARKKTLRLSYLEQVPQFRAGDSIQQALLQRSHDPVESLPRAYELMAKLDLNRFGAEFPVENLSGGWKKRVALARELLSDPELLFLDEPTNHLDLSGILWLESFLKNAPFALLMITHDRLFLQRTVNHVLDLDPRNPGYLLDVKGDYLTYLEAKEHELNALKRQERVLKNTLRREKEWLGHGALARQTKQRARVQAAETLNQDVQQLSEKNRGRKVDLEFQSKGHAPQKLIEAVALGKAFDGQQSLFENVNLLITPQTRLALLGDNGSGKSTLVRLLLGLETPSTGKVQRAENLKTAYFEQNRDTLDPRKSVLKNICPDGDYVDFNGQFVHVRSYLDRFLFSSEKAELPVAQLSGGEQARLRLAQLMMNPGQILILDEPTNDLDAETLEVLEEALNEYQGAVILVTHDRYFMDTVADQILAFPLGDSKDRTLTKFAGYFQWERWFQEMSKTARGEEARRSKSEVGPTETPRSRVKLSYKEKYEMETMEEKILALESEIDRLTQESQAPKTLSDHARLNEVLALLAERQSELDAKYERWAELEEKSKA